MEEIIFVAQHGSEDQGFLSVFDTLQDFGFAVQRIYYTYGVKHGAMRGNHAHKSLSQAIWCPYGRIDITVDNGHSKTLYSLDRPDKAILIPGGLWLTLEWKQADSVLCAAVSEPYSEEDYIRDYAQYLNFIRKEHA